MRALLIAAVSASLIAPWAVADPGRPYEEMSYSELKALDTDGLTKAERKRHKKALNAAEKIFKKEQRQRAKAEKAARKSADNMLSEMEKSYRLTKTRKNIRAGKNQTFSKAVYVRSLPVLGKNGLLEFFLATDSDGDGVAVNSYIVARTKLSEAVDNANTLMPSSQRKTGNSRKRQWNSYVVRYYKRQQAMQLAKNTIEKNVIRLGTTEELVIPLSTPELFRPVRYGSGLSISLDSDISKSMNLEVPFAYLVGYFAKLADDKKLSEKDSLLVKRIQEAIRAQSKD